MVNFKDMQPEMIAEVQQLWCDGVTVSKIGSRYGVTKSVVAGKIFRLRNEGYDFPVRGTPIIRPDAPKRFRLPPGPSAEPRAGSSAEPRAGSKTTLLPKPIERAAAAPRRSPAVYRNRVCTWVKALRCESASGEAEYCGEDTAGHRAYCPDHVALAYVPTRSRRVSTVGMY